MIVNNFNNKKESYQNLDHEQLRKIMLLVIKILTTIIQMKKIKNKLYLVATKIFMELLEKKDD